MIDLPDLSLKPVDFDDETISYETNYVTENESETQALTDEVPKSPKVPPPDNDDV